MWVSFRSSPTGTDSAAAAGRKARASHAAMTRCGFICDLSLQCQDLVDIAEGKPGFGASGDHMDATVKHASPEAVACARHRRQRRPAVGLRIITLGFSESGAGA